MAKRIDKLTPAQEAQMDAWADKWIEIGLRTGSADRALFEDAARRCYEAAGLKWHDRVVWVPSPLVMALAAPIAGHILDRKVSGAVRDAVRGAVSGAVGGAVGGAVSGAVRDAVRDAVSGAVSGAVRDAVDGAVDGAVSDAFRLNWHRYIGGQFWVGGWWWGGAYTSFFREACGLELKGDLWDRGLAYEDTLKSACWWWPHRDFVMVCERPTVIKREVVDPARPRGWGSHRLHSLNGPAVGFRDGWGVYAVHGVRVPAEIIEDNSTITVARIEAEENAEVRRVMIDLYKGGRDAGGGPAAYLADSGAKIIHEDKDLLGANRRLLWKDVVGDEPIVMIDVRNSTREPDGSWKRYQLRVDPNAYGGRAGRECLAAVASTWRDIDGSMLFARPEDYAPHVET